MHDRELIYTMFRVLPRIGNALLLGAVLIASYSVVGMALFSGVYPDRFQNFDTFGASALAMAVLTTTENFPDILLPGLAVYPVQAAVFFCSFIFTGVWLLMSFILAVMFDYYQVAHEEQLVHSRTEEQLSLLVAFRLLLDAQRPGERDEEPGQRRGSHENSKGTESQGYGALDRNHRPAKNVMDGSESSADPAAGDSQQPQNGDTIDYHCFRALLRELRPRAGSQEAFVLFSILGTSAKARAGRDVRQTMQIQGQKQQKQPQEQQQEQHQPPVIDRIDLESFLTLADVLRYRLERQVVTPSVDTDHESVGQQVWRVFTTPTPAFQRVVNSKWWQRAVSAMIIANAIVVCLWGRNRSYDFLETLDVCNRVLVAGFATEVLLGVCAEGLKSYVAVERWQVVLLLLSVVSEASLSSSMPVLLGCEGAATIGGTCLHFHAHILQLVRAMRVFRVIRVSRNAKQVVSAFAKGGETMLRFMAVLSLLFYCYAVLGMELFAHRKPPPRPGSKWNPETFDDTWKALLSLFQIATSNNWNDVMYVCCAGDLFVVVIVGSCLLSTNPYLHALSLYPHTGTTTWTRLQRHGFSLAFTSSL